MNTQVADHLVLADFDYHLPESLIAQKPLEERHRSRLMVLDRSSGAIEHRTFHHLIDYLHAGDVLVLNDTKVMPCRIAARKPGGGKAEIFLVRERALNVWDALVKGASGAGRKLTVNSGISAEILQEGMNGIVTVRFEGAEDIRQQFPAIGLTPLPPYIRREPLPEDQERYQTVYARSEGAVAAPTAGLHFTDQLLDELRRRGVTIAAITLHVGPGTFQPIRSEQVSEHRMHAEQFEVGPDAAKAINSAKSEGRRVIAVGTTSVRALETAADAQGSVSAGKGESSLFIYPGYAFRVVDGLVTNFHLPKSTLLLLVSAFAGRDRVLEAYRTAVAMQYRFFSYGDAMLIR